MIKNLKNLLKRIFRRPLGGPIDPTQFLKKNFGLSGDTSPSGYIHTTDNGFVEIYEEETTTGNDPVVKASLLMFDDDKCFGYSNNSDSGYTSLTNAKTNAFATVGFVLGSSGGGGGSTALDAGLTAETVYAPWKFTNASEKSIYYRIYTGTSVAVTAGINSIELGATSTEVKYILHNSGSYALTTDGYLYTLNTMDGFVYYDISSKSFYLQVNIESDDTMNYRVFLIYQ